jgi:hypothetical protein
MSEDVDAKIAELTDWRGEILARGYAGSFARPIRK